ncbi:mannitol dehydrogenase family protein [Paracoccus thiocyanatus]|uniref:D-mannonate oxidoreductase n=1 Tax=Paracoccus thiocyanatus TaxID=34006 RepID=A0A3D8PF38_9RHOB|nr:mannitol dehydrogenase family protein [Paracoccus thiocyanatus]RDW14077.1 D-mannonate oxidoreductase [Paracoccus thiocyanatus]
MTRILQFGTSRFLQAHACLFAHEANVAGDGPVAVTVVKGTPDAGRAGRVAALADPDGYPVRLRGLQAGKAVDGQVTVRAVKAALALPQDWAALGDVFVTGTDAVISNTGDTGYAEMPGDLAAIADPRQCPAGFPARLTALLLRRWQAGGSGLPIYPCELISGNGDVLRGVIDAMALRAGLPPAFRDWLGREVHFANSLVDRIVSEPIEPAGAVAEPYALWAIGAPGLAPFAHPSIVVVPDLEPLERLKLHLLNLSHTVLAERWLQGASADLTVQAALALPLWREMLLEVVHGEVLPGFAWRGMAGPARDYLATTMERFDNPFLDHRLSDIAQNHPAKVQRRIGGFLDWVAGGGLSMPLLRDIHDRRRAHDC